MKPCTYCGVVFDAHHARVLYCSDECRVAGSPRKAPHTKTTAERGYGTEHQKMRAALLAVFVAGTLCGFCDEPMFVDQALDLDHSDPASRWRGEPGDRLTHARCNRRDAARRRGLRKAV